MSNPLFNMFNNQGNNDIIFAINQFKANFKGDPKQKVQELLNSGQMSQAQFNQLSQEANRIMQMLK